MKNRSIPSGESFRGALRQLVNDKKRLTLLIGGAVLILFGLAFRFYPYYEGIIGSEADITDTKSRIAMASRIVKGKGRLEANLASLEKSLGQAEAGLLTGKTAALAAVDIQNTLNEIALGTGIEIKSMQVLKSQDPKQDAEPYVSVPVQFSVSLTIRQLKDILYKIETSPKFFLTVEWIRIGLAGAASPGQIRCDIAVSGIMKNVKE
jgi:hypothetical protein